MHRPQYIAELLDSPSWLMATVKGASAAIAGAVLATPAAVQFLLMFMAMDYATGMIAGWIEGKLSSTVGLKGAAKKLLVLFLVGASYSAVKALGLKFDLGAAVAMVYVINELVSIVENCSRAGVPVPKSLQRAIAKAKKTAEL